MREFLNRSTTGSRAYDAATARSHRLRNRTQLSAASGWRSAGTWLALVGLVATNACSNPSTAAEQSGAVTITPKEVRVPVGGTALLGVIVRDATGTEMRGAQVFWASADTTIAVVSSAGLVQARKAGTVKIAASVSGSSDVATVIVAPQSVASITVSPPSSELTVGRTLQLTATFLGAGGESIGDRAVSWRSDKESVATVDASGRVTGVGPGTAIITATSEGRTGSAAVSIVAVPAGSVAISPATLALTVGQTSAPLSTTVRDASGNILPGRSVFYTSSDLAVAAVGQDGVVRGVGGGTATITATSEGRSATTAVTVAAPPTPPPTPPPSPPAGPAVASVTISPENRKIDEGDALTLTATCRDASGQAVSGVPIGWSMTASRSGVASFVVTSATQIRVQGLNEGTAVFTATCGGRSGSTTVRVEED